MSVKLSIYSAVMAVLLLACNNKPKENPAKKQGGGNKTVEITGYVAKSEKFVSDILVPGTLVANESVQIQPEVSGRIIQLNIPEGKVISKGTLIAKLFDADLRAQLDKLEAQKKLSEAEVKRTSDLLKINGVSMQEFENAQNKLNNILADIEIAKVSIVKTEIRAPFNGIVSAKLISNGAYVSPATILTTLQEIDPLKLTFSVPEKYKDLVKLGMKLTFKTDASEKKYTATVYLVNPTIDLSTRTVQVFCRVPNPGRELLPGAFTNVSFRLDSKENAIMVPTQAIIPEARGKNVVIIRDGKADIVPVETGLRSDARIQILKGVSPGDTIAVTGIMQMRKEAPVKVVNLIEDPTRIQ